MKRIAVFYFILLLTLMLVAYYIGFVWDVGAFEQAVVRVVREMTVGQTAPVASPKTTFA